MFIFPRLTPKFQRQPAFIFSKQYAQIAYNRPIVVPRYDEPPRPINAETRSILESGTLRCRKMRLPYGSKKRIPGVLMMGNKDPIYLKLNPAQIKTFLVYDHFLGKRYSLTVDQHTTYEVIPQHIGVNPINYEPESVTFALWTGKAPKPLWTPEERKKFRPAWEIPYLNELRLKRDLKFVHNSIKEKLQSLPAITMREDADGVELAKHYNFEKRKKHREKFPTIMDEVHPMLAKSWHDPSTKVLELEKEERNPDDPHDEKEDDDEDGNQ